MLEVGRSRHAVNGGGDFSSTCCEGRTQTPGVLYRLALRTVNGRVDSGMIPTWSILELGLDSPAFVPPPVSTSH